MDEVVDARKEKIGDDQAWEMIKSQSRVFIGKGKKVLEFLPGKENREEILKAAMGRSGNLRAPTLKTGKNLFVGYNDEIYTRL